MCVYRFLVITVSLFKAVLWSWSRKRIQSDLDHCWWIRIRSDLDDHFFGSGSGSDLDHCWWIRIRSDLDHFCWIRIRFGPLLVDTELTLGY